MASIPDSSQPVVYILRVRAMPFFKIGLAARMAVRLAELQTGNPFELQVIATYSVPDLATALRIEKQLHREMKTSFGRHIRGEWYELNTSQQARLRKRVLAVAQGAQPGMAIENHQLPVKRRRDPKERNPFYPWPSKLARDVALDAYRARNDESDAFP